MPLTFYKSPDTLIADQDKFEKDIAEFVSGAMDPVKFKAFRVAHGVYEQRQLETYMIRIRCAAGGITPRQLRKVAELAAAYGSNEVHFTTRSEVQVHDVLIENVMNVIRGLNDVELSSRGGGGNTIRNILVSADSGVDPNEVFDVDPYAIALTSRMISEDDSWNLPRKFKIAFSNSKADTAYTQATCLGFVATIKDGQKGFEVYCAGGMGAKPMVGHQLIDFIPDNKVYQVTKAIKIMFDKHGNRRSKFSSRIKFLWKKLDREEFVALFNEEYDKIKDDASLDLKLNPIPNEDQSQDIQIETVDSAEYELWKTRYVFKQKQEGLASVKIPLQLGDLLREDADLLCDFLEKIGENTIRCDRAQNIRLRNIPEKYLGNLYNVLQRLGMTLVDYAPFIGNMINCTGAQTCKLGICLPRGLSKAIRERLEHSDLDLDSITDFRLNMSGCPNTCGMHHIANLGFFGKVGRVDGDMYPAYNVLAGATTGAGSTTYAQRQGELSAHFIPDFAYDFLKVWIERKKDATYETYNDFLEEEGNALIKTLCDKYSNVPAFNVDPKFYTDFGAKARLSLDEIGTAECSAGLFDMIDVDKKTIKTSLKALDAGEGDEQEILYSILHAASRMLLITRGLDVKDDITAFKLFQKHFVTTNLVDSSYADLVALGENEDKAALPAQKERVLKLADDVNELYSNMDDSLRFKTPSGEVIEETVAEVPEVKTHDFRGVACPMNFVKTKLVMATMQSQEQLIVLLDDGEPIQNVPNSVALEGHKVLSKTKVDSHWEVLIEKA